MLLSRVHAQVANLEAFDTERSISLVPPDGEFALANYRTSHALRLPFRLSISTESDPASDHKVGACGHRQIMLMYMCGQMSVVRQQCSMLTDRRVGWAHAPDDTLSPTPVSIPVARVSASFSLHISW
jgi:hypothetical protein